MELKRRLLKTREKIKKGFSKVYKSPTTKKIIVIIVISGGLIFYPNLKARALEEMKKAVESTDIKNTPFLNKAGNKVKVGVLTLTGLKVCMDPTAPPVKKAIAGAKLICCGGYASANIISSLTVVTPQAKIISSACCGLAWLGLSGLEYIDAKGNM